MPDGKSAVVPLQDLIRGAAKILTYDEKLAACKQANIDKAKELAKNQELIESQERRIGRIADQVDRLMEEAEFYEAKFDECSQDAARLRPWATFGRITLYGGLATAAYFGYRGLAK